MAVVLLVSLASAPAVDAAAVHPLSIMLDAPAHDFLATGLVLPEPSADDLVVVQLGLGDSSASPDQALLSATRVSYELKRETEFPEAPETGAQPPRPMVGASLRQDVPTEQVELQSPVILTNVTIRLDMLQVAPQIQLRALHNGSSAAQLELSEASCRIRPVAGNPYAFPQDSRSLVSVGPLPAPRRSLDADCRPGAAGLGTAHGAFLYGMDLIVESAEGEPKHVQTGTFEEPILGTPLRQKVTQFLVLWSEDDGPLVLGGWTPTEARVRAPTFHAAGTLQTWPETGHGQWGALSTADPVEAVAATGIFTLQASVGAGATIFGHSVNEPSWATAQAARTHAAPPVTLAVGAAIALAALAGLAALFSRLSRQSVEEHPRRQGILEAVRHDPGLDLGTLARRLGCAWPAARYHTLRLSRARLVRIHRVGGRWSVFPATATDVGRLAVLARPGMRRAHDLLIQNGPMGQRALAEALGVSQQAASKALRRLIEAQLVEPAAPARPVAYRAVAAAPLGA